MTVSTRNSALAARHRALGSGLEDWNGMGTAWTYDSNPNDEHDAIREAAGLFDMSPLKKVWIRGADAGAVVDDVATRDMTRITPGRATYTAVLTDAGTVCDDAIISNNGDNEWMLVHGSGDSLAHLKASAQGRNADVIFDDDLDAQPGMIESCTDQQHRHCRVPGGGDPVASRRVIGAGQHDQRPDQPDRERNQQDGTESLRPPVLHAAAGRPVINRSFQRIAQCLHNRPPQTIAVSTSAVKTTIQPLVRAGLSSSMAPVSHSR